MTGLRCTTSELDGEPIVELSGSLDLATVATLRDHVLDVVITHPGGVVTVDLDEVISLDDVGIGVLLGLAGRARELGGDLRLVCSPGRTRDRLALTGADRAVAVVESSATATPSAGVSRPRSSHAPEPIFHLALPDDWRRAGSVGEYTMSTRGRTLAEEGFIHCSYEHQIVDTANRFYGDVDDVVLLRIDPARLRAPVIADDVGGEQFPHVYGPIVLDAVTDARPWRRQPMAEWSLAIQ